MKDFLMETFPNYTEEMYNGNEPNYYSPGINGDIANYSCRYGGGKIDHEGNLIHSSIYLDKLNTIYIAGKFVKFIHIKKHNNNNLIVKTKKVEHPDNNNNLVEKKKSIGNSDIIK